MRILLASFVVLALATGPALPDEVTEAIDSAREAYEAGDIRYATDELNFALQLLGEMKAGSLQSFLPEPLEGWTRELDDGASASMAMMGGGVVAEARYTDDPTRDAEGEKTFSITLVADNPMVGAMSGMLGNVAMITASGAKMVRVGREKFLDQDGELTGLIGNRVLVQAKGNDPDVIIAHLETMDFRALANFGN